MKRKVISLVLALSMMLTCAQFAFAAEGDETGNEVDTQAPTSTVEPGMDNFKRSQTYAEGQFTDVAATAWYAASVKDAYEYALMGGVSANKFNPDGNLTIAETITMAARLNSIYMTGESLALDATDSWYAPYVAYATENSIITQAYADYDKAATRAEFADIFSRALPEATFSNLNEIADDSLPDVKMTDPYAASIYRLYRAGILTGNDAQGTYTPNASIERSAAAAIVTRMADVTLRKGYVEPTEPTEPEVKYYEAFPGIPDFGAYLEIDPVVIVDNIAIYNAKDAGEKAVENYIELLVSLEFEETAVEDSELKIYTSKDTKYAVSIEYTGEEKESIQLQMVAKDGRIGKSYYVDTEIETFTAITDVALKSFVLIAKEDYSMRTYVYDYTKESFDKYVKYLTDSGFTKGKELSASEDSTDKATEYTKDGQSVLVMHSTQFNQTWILVPTKK